MSYDFAFSFVFFAFTLLVRRKIDTRREGKKREAELKKGYEVGREEKEEKGREGKREWKRREETEGLTTPLCFLIQIVTFLRWRSSGVVCYGSEGGDEKAEQELARLLPAANTIEGNLTVR